MKKYAKKVLCLVLAMVMACTMLAACSAGAGSAAASQDELQKIMSNGKITVAISLGNEPWCWKDADGEVKGLAIDLIEGFAEKMEIDIEYVTLEFSGLIPAVQSGKADIIATNLTRKPSRAASVLFTESVGCTFGVALTRKGEFASLDDINNSSVTLTTEVGSNYETVGTETFPNATMAACENNSDALAAVKSGRADVMVTDLAIASSACAADDSLEYMTPYIYTDTLAFGVKCDASAMTLAEAFNTHLRVIKADGTYAALYEKYFGNEWVPMYTDSAM